MLRPAHHPGAVRWLPWWTGNAAPSAPDPRTIGRPDGSPPAGEACSQEGPGTAPASQGARTELWVKENSGSPGDLHNEADLQEAGARVPLCSGEGLPAPRTAGQGQQLRCTDCKCAGHLSPPFSASPLLGMQVQRSKPGWRGRAKASSPVPAHHKQDLMLLAQGRMRAHTAAVLRNPNEPAGS